MELPKEPEKQIKKKIEIITQSIEIVSEEKLKALLKGELLGLEFALKEIEKNEIKKTWKHSFGAIKK